MHGCPDHISCSAAVTPICGAETLREADEEGPHGNGPDDGGKDEGPAWEEGIEKQVEDAGALKSSKSSRIAILLNDATYGIINFIVGIPTLISFANIIFSVSPATKKPVQIWLLEQGLLLQHNQRILSRALVWLIGIARP